MKLDDILNETQLLLELGDAPYSWQWLEGAPNPDGEYGYQLGGKVNFTDGEDNFAVKIYYDSDNETTTIYWNKNNSFTGENTNKSPVRVIFTIMDIIREYVGIIKPKYIKFSANKALYGSRNERNKLGSLYSTLVKKFAAKAGYSSEIEGDDWQADFLLTRRDKKFRADR